MKYKAGQNANALDAEEKQVQTGIQNKQNRLKAKAATLDATEEAQINTEFVEEQTKLIMLQKKISLNESIRREMADVGRMVTDMIKNSTGTAQALFSKPSTTYAPKTPKMGGLTDANCGDVAWCGGKPRNDWKGLEVTPDPALEDPSPTQMRSKDSKAAIAQLKRAEGIYSTDEKKFTKKEGDVDDITNQLFKKFVESAQ